MGYRFMKTALFAAAALIAVATPALAQSDPAATSLPDPNDQSDTLTIGVGGAILPDYEGSNDYRLIPAAAVRGRVGGIAFFSRATYLYADLIPRGPGKLEFDAGPIVGVRLNRTGKIKDDVVARLPDPQDRRGKIITFTATGMPYNGSCAASFAARRRRSHCSASGDAFTDECQACRSRALRISPASTWGSVSASRIRPPSTERWRSIATSACGKCISRTTGTTAWRADATTRCRA